MPESKKINLGINDGQEFFAHEMSINFNPTQFIFDFKCVTPRSDPRSKEAPYITIRHNIVIADAYHAKKMQELLTKVISDYEKKFGKIEKPKPLKVYEKKSKKKSKEKSKETVPSYLG